MGEPGELREGRCLGLPQADTASCCESTESGWREQRVAASSQQRPGPCAGRAEGGRRGLAGIFQLIPFASLPQTLILLILGVGGLVLRWGNNATPLSLGFPSCIPAIVTTMKPLAPNNVKRGSAAWLGSVPMGLVTRYLRLSSTVASDSLWSGGTALGWMV